MSDILDKTDMKAAIISFPNQIEESFQIMNNWIPKRKYLDIKNIIILGMGGSAIGGDVARVIMNNHCMVPIVINRTYTIPKWVDSNTLVLASSYSGDTEETLSCFLLCHERNCPIVVLSTGGILTKHAKDFDLDTIIIPKGYQPRAALGFSFTLMILILKYLGFIHHSVVDNLRNSIAPIKKLCSELSESKNEAWKIANKIHATCPIIYGSEHLTWVAAVRFKCQLAENAKMLAYHYNFPEQNHNELEGWTKNKDILNKFSIVWIRDTDDHPGNKVRMDIVSSMLDPIACFQTSISQSGSNSSERLLKLIHYTDWITYYIALLNNVDPSSIRMIKKLKTMMGNVN